MWISLECLSSTREYSVFDTYMGPPIYLETKYVRGLQTIFRTRTSNFSDHAAKVKNPGFQTLRFCYVCLFCLNILPLSRERNFHAYLSRQIPSYSGVSGPLQDIFVNNIQQEEASNCLVNPWDDR